MGLPLKLLHFTVSGRRFAVPVGEIAEIREIGAITTVPGAPAAIAGVAELRGRIVTLLDLATIFELDPVGTGTRLAIPYSEPRAHLALVVPLSASDLKTGEAVDPAPGSGTIGPGELGVEIVLTDGVPAFLLDLDALARLAGQRVRDGFRIGA